MIAGECDRAGHGWGPPRNSGSRRATTGCRPPVGAGIRPDQAPARWCQWRWPHPGRAWPPSISTSMSSAIVEHVNRPRHVERRPVPHRTRRHIGNVDVLLPLNRRRRGRGSGDEPPVRLMEGPPAVGRRHHLNAALVHRAMMPPAQPQQVAEARGAAIGPVFDVMRVTSAAAAGTAPALRPSPTIRRGSGSGGTRGRPP